MALLISYLPTIYSAHHEREKGISVLRPFAGTPPSPVDLLSNLQRLGTLDNPDLWQTAARAGCSSWTRPTRPFRPCAISPSRSPDQSWVASVGSMLDAAALLLSASDFNSRGHTPSRASRGR